MMSGKGKSMDIEDTLVVAGVCGGRSGQIQKELFMVIEL